MIDLWVYCPFSPSPSYGSFFRTSMPSPPPVSFLLPSATEPLLDTLPPRLVTQHDIPWWAPSLSPGPCHGTHHNRSHPQTSKQIVTKCKLAMSRAGLQIMMGGALWSMPLGLDTWKMKGDLMSHDARHEGPWLTVPCRQYYSQKCTWGVDAEKLANIFSCLEQLYCAKTTNIE